MYFNLDNTPDIVIRPNKGHWMHYSYSYVAVADGRTGDLLWTFNSSQSVMTSPITILSKNQGQDGLLFIASGKSREQAGEMNDQTLEKRGTSCARTYVPEDRKTCAAQLKKDARQRRHEEDG